jgi:hypothetical protein
MNRFAVGIWVILPMFTDQLRVPPSPPQPLESWVWREIPARSWGLPFRFADEEMDVLGHDQVSDNNELLALAHLFEHGEK